MITGNKASIHAFKSEVSKEWEMTDEGRLFWCLNLRVTRDFERDLMKIDQAQYAHEILKRFSMESCNPRRTPMKDKPVLSAVTCPVKNESYDEVFPFAAALGCLLYLVPTSHAP